MRLAPTDEGSVVEVKAPGQACPGLPRVGDAYAGAAHDQFRRRRVGFSHPQLKRAVGGQEVAAIVSLAHA